MLKVGITGGIGSGKTLVCRMFENLGVPIYEADQQARTLTRTDPNIRSGLKSLFGDDIYSISGDLDRKRLASIIFTDPDTLKKVNEIVHPVVRNHFFEWASSRHDMVYVLQEAAILFESGFYKMMDKVITITAPLETRVERVMERDNVTRGQVMARISNQMPEKEKVDLSDYVIVNDGKQMIIPQVLQIDQQLRTLF